jgi:hypothetical protein
MPKKADKLFEILRRLAPEQVFSEDDNFLVVINDDYNLLKKIGYNFPYSSIDYNGGYLALYIPVKDPDLRV